MRFVLVIALSFLLVFSPLVGFCAGDPRLSVDDLGFTEKETQPDLGLQHLLTKRSHALKTHQVLALITAVPMTLNALLPPDDGGGDGQEGIPGAPRQRSNVALHETLGIATAALYTTTACFALFAPKPKDLKRSGSTRIHRYLAIIHGAAMIATPILGEMAKRQINRGEEVHGAASMHGAAVATLLISYGAALGIMVIKF